MRLDCHSLLPQSESPSRPLRHFPTSANASAIHCSAARLQLAGRRIGGVGESGSGLDEGAECSRGGWHCACRICCRLESGDALDAPLISSSCPPSAWSFCCCRHCSASLFASAPLFAPRCRTPSLSSFTSSAVVSLSLSCVACCCCCCCCCSVCCAASCLLRSLLRIIFVTSASAAYPPAQPSS